MSEQLYVESVPVGTMTLYTQVITSGFDLILPCYNPPEGWVNVLHQHFAELTALMGNVPIQLIVVNDGSAKNFGPAEIDSLHSAIPDIIIVNNEVNRGKGYAVRSGVKQARYDFQVCTDLDFPFGTAAIRDVYLQLMEGADIVAGQRGKRYLQLLPLKRKFATVISRLLNRFVLHLRVQDAQAGLKGFNYYGQQILLATEIDGFLYDSEFIYKASKLQELSISSVDIICRPDIRFSSFSTVLLYREVLNYISILKSR
jgi:glycosyltransferase involved in cell wall biosynthesis